jgi:hypothetical protein
MHMRDFSAFWINLVQRMLISDALKFSIQEKTVTN